MRIKNILLSVCVVGIAKVLKDSFVESFKSKQLNTLLVKENKNLQRRIDNQKDREQTVNKLYDELGTRLKAIDRYYNGYQNWVDICTIHNYEMIQNDILREAEDILIEADRRKYEL